MTDKTLRLDVGCGEYPKGDVNCDLFTSDIGHWTGKNQMRVLNTKKIPNFVVCDSQHLPFQSGTFDLVYCSHVIEHVAQPFLLFKELYRVSKRKIVIKCPHRLGERMFLPKNPFHLNFFKTSWFGVAAGTCWDRQKQCPRLRFEVQVFSVGLFLLLPRSIRNNHRN